MGAAELLKSFREGTPGCRVATFADLSAGLVLFTTSDARLPQERLDALCEGARTKLSAGSSPAIAAALGSSVTAAVVPEDGHLLVFVRSAADPNEAILCDCAADADVHAVITRAADALSAIDSPD